MIWYSIDGRSRGQREAKLDEKDSFNEYHPGFCGSSDGISAKQKTGSLVDAVAG